MCVCVAFFFFFNAKKCSCHISLLTFLHRSLCSFEVCYLSTHEADLLVKIHNLSRCKAKHAHFENSEPVASPCGRSRAGHLHVLATSLSLVLSVSVLALIWPLMCSSSCSRSSMETKGGLFSSQCAQTQVQNVKRVFRSIKVTPLISFSLACVC